ncbi:hypothetical protein OK016_00755 [Vibrio chagasii]|nr:hypothetical protein [Vibrio chagasii]
MLNSTRKPLITPLYARGKPKNMLLACMVWLLPITLCLTPPKFGRAKTVGNAKMRIFDAGELMPIDINDQLDESLTGSAYRDPLAKTRH